MLRNYSGKCGPITEKRHWFYLQRKLDFLENQSWQLCDTIRVLVVHFTKKRIRPIFPYLIHDYIETEMNLCTVPECTIRNIVRFPANNFDYNPDCNRTLPGTISRNTFQKPPIHQGGKVLGYQPVKMIKDTLD